MRLKNIFLEVYIYPEYPIHPGYPDSDKFNKFLKKHLDVDV
ncbi:hypothetical protein MTBBW1_410082 [Desulfamplus magnetovallimortis]|uniref:Uncharacterized protein n=1 Tax=Desulfamplus magnetovallimortis TaxID=1246637 RepID=A0A1W1HGV1_9BACT|nr:hypothetical protein MTBBW1_410082 [Desulfamplus magnetovallimortis]